MKVKGKHVEKGQLLRCPIIVLKRVLVFMLIVSMSVGSFMFIDTIRVKAREDEWFITGGSNVSTIQGTKNIVMMYYGVDGWWGDTDRENEWYEYREGTFDMYSNLFNTIPGTLSFSSQWYPSGIDNGVWFDTYTYNNYSQVSQDVDNWENLRTRQHALYTTLKVFTAPYSGYFNINCTAPKGQGGRIGCHMHRGGVGGFGSSFNGDIWLNEGETLIFLMGAAMGEAAQVGDAYNGDDEANCSGLSGASIFIYKYANSDNLVSEYNKVMNFRGISRQYDSSRDILFYFEEHRGYGGRLKMPNSTLVAIVGGGGGYNAHCEPAGTDFEFNGSGSGYWYYEGAWRYVQAVKGAQPIMGVGNQYNEHLVYGFKEQGFVLSGIEDGFRRTFKGLYVDPTTGATSSVEGNVYEQTGNGVNESKVEIRSIGNYIFYKGNFPDGMTGSGSMSATRVPRGVDGVLAENTFTVENRKFAGWSTTSTGSVVYKDMANIGQIGSDITLYAVWKPNDYTIKYLSNAPSGKTASGSMADAVVDSGLGYTLDLNQYSIEGYKFMGWGTSADSGVIYYNGGRVDPREDDLTLYAVWEKVGYNVNVMNNGPADATEEMITVK